MGARGAFGGKWVGALGLALAALAGSASGQENLLKNPGFEVFREGLPVDWASYVMPQEGAIADLDRTRACQGKNSILLSTAAPYAVEPLNNWSQNVTGSFAGKTLVLRGAIRTEEAGDAALWLQCWRKSPWSVAAVASTGAVQPVSGTQNWTRVEARVVVPKNTDYLTVRAVLKGTGQAWFDDVSLVEEIPEKPAGAVAAKPANPAPAAGALVPPTPPVPPKRPEAVAAQVAAPQAPTAPQNDRAMQEVINANRMLLESYEAVRDTNDELGEQVKTLQREVNSLRRQVRQKQKAAETQEPQSPAGEASAAQAENVQRPQTQPALPPPPLVPSVRQEGENER